MSVSGFLLEVGLPPSAVSGQDLMKIILKSEVSRFLCAAEAAGEQQVWPALQRHSQIHGPASHLQSTSLSTHQILLLWEQGSGEKWKKKCFAFRVEPLPCLFCKGLWQSASRDVQCLVQCRLSLQVASCHSNRSPNNASIWNAERNCGIWAVWKIANL